MNKRIAPSSLLASVCTAAALSSFPVHADDVVVLRAKTIHVGDGTTIDNGVVIVRDGRIEAVGSELAVPENARIIEVEQGSITPGLIDANALLEPADLIAQPESRRRGVLSFLHRGHSSSPSDPCYMCDGSVACAFAETHEDLEPDEICPICGQAADGSVPLASGVLRGVSRTEGSSEVVPHTLVIDSVDLTSPDFDRLVRAGVTTVFAAPDSAAVIGPRGTVLKTSGPVTERVVEAEGPVQAAIGSDPYSYGSRNGSPSRWGQTTTSTRRPQSRMGVAWVFRKAFHDAAGANPEPWLSGADRPSNDALEVLRAVAEREIPLRVHARTMRDINTAFRVCDEFGLSFTLLEATEAYRCLDVIAGRKVPVVYGPIYDQPNGVTALSRETSEVRLTTPRRLLDAGIETAISARDLREEDGLARQAMYAMRAGLTAEEALQCVTSTPAKLLGIDDRVGTLAAGKDADIVVWSGAPFEATSRPVCVVVNGRIAFEEATK